METATIYIITSLIPVFHAIDKNKLKIAVIRLLIIHGLIAIHLIFKITEFNYLYLMAASLLSALIVK
jgi:hypothetical protein